MKKKDIAVLIVALLGLLAAYPQLKSSVLELAADITWLLSQV